MIWVCLRGAQPACGSSWSRWRMFSRPGGASGLVSVAGIWGGFGGSFWVNAWRGGKRLEALCFPLKGSG